MAASDQDGAEASFLPESGGIGALIANYDWASTSLGPLSAWPQSLKTVVAIMLRSRVAMSLLWGEAGVTLYNEAYAALIGKRHPGVLGSKARESWPEVAEICDQTMRIVLAGGTRVFRDLELTTFRAGRPEQIWLDVDCSPVPDESGRPAGVLIINVETTQRALKQREAAASAARQRRMFEQAPGFIILLSGPDLIVEFVNEAHKRMFGDHNAEGRPYIEAFADIAELSPEIIDQVYKTGERYVGRAETVAIPQPGGQAEERFYDVIVEPVTADDDQVIGIFVEGIDLTEQVRAQLAAEESNRRLSAAVAIARLGAYEWELETGKATLDERARAIFGFGPDESLTFEVLQRRIDSNDFQRGLAKGRAAEAAGRRRREGEFRVHLPDGSIRDVASITDSVPGADGRAVRVIGVFDDVTERRRAEQRQRLLINELNHRVKNTLAMVQSIAAQTLRAAPDLPNARSAFEARLVALAAAHDLLTAESWRGARLGDVAATAMAPFESTQRPQIRRSGPPVWVSAPRALALSLALHELATNAAKYGALSVPEGRAIMDWSQTAEGELTLSWIEQGGPPVAAPVRSGFGARLLQRSLARELEAEVDLSFAPEGVRCEIRFKVEAARSEPAFRVAEI